LFKLKNGEKFMQKSFHQKLIRIASEKLSGHFLYRTAEEILKAFPNQDLYVAEAGFTPSGKIHLGNFNDLCITYAIVQILEFWGYRGKAILAIDSRDPFRQAPIFAPPSFKEKEEELRGLPFDEIEDPWGCHENFAEHFIEPVISSLKDYGLKIEPIRAKEIHTNPQYIELLRKILVERKRVREILNRIREKAGHKRLYPENWIPYRPKCGNCGRMDEDVVPLDVSNDGKYVKYKCNHCGYKGEADITKAEGKPPFRLDWPLRWVLFNVHFEPMGKDLMASGSSYDTGKALMIEFFQKKPPLSVFYDFFYWIPPTDVSRETKLKFSKRKGVGFGMNEWLHYAPPEVLKYLILRRQIADIYSESLKHVDFSPLDIPSYVDAYDRHEETFYKIINKEIDLPKPDTDRILATYILSQVDIQNIQPKKPRRLGYSTAIEVALWMESVDDGLNMLKRMGKLPRDITDFELEDTKRRLLQAKNWVEQFYQPQLPDIENIRHLLSQNQLVALERILHKLLSIPKEEIDMSRLRPIVKEVADQLGIKTKDIYEAIYLATLNRTDGPPIARLLKRDFIRNHLKKMLDYLFNVADNPK